MRTAELIVKRNAFMLEEQHVSAGILKAHSDFDHDLAHMLDGLWPPSGRGCCRYPRRLKTKKMKARRHRKSRSTGDRENEMHNDRDVPPAQ